MFKNEYTLILDLKKKMTAKVPQFVQYDNATLVFKIFDDGKMYDLTSYTKAEVAHKRPDGQVVVGTANLETLINGERVVRYNYLGSEMHSTGFVETSLSIFSQDKKVTTQPFKVEIITDNRDGLIQSSKKEVGLLQEMITEVSSVLVDAKNAINDANDAVTIATQATTDANTAITNANLAVTEAQDAANATIQVKDDTLIAKGEAEQATINANNAVSNLVHKGEYNATVSYIPRNIVSFDGSSYMNIAPSVGVSPTSTTNWRVISKKGDTGDRGIQGIQGIPGDRGRGFSITKTYSSVAQMYADYSNPSIPIGDFVLINTSDINNPENAMLFVKTNIEYSYLTDLSGAQGIKGDAGKDGNIFTWKDVYSNTSTYLKDNVVSYNGSSFIALKINLGITPTNDGINWNIVAQRGVDGTGAVSTVDGLNPDANGDVITHTNKTVLDALTDDAGQLKYNGTTVGSVTSVNGQVGDVTGLETVINSNSKLVTKVDKVAGKQLSTEDYTTAEKTKLSGITTNANNYSHPATHPPSIIVQDASNRFMTDTEKTKLSGIATSANNYTHPANHPPSIITQDASNRFMTDVEKTKLNGIETGAQANTITSVNGATGAITGLATDISVDNKIGVLNGGLTEHTLPSKTNAHVISNITGLQSALDSKSTFSGNYNDLTNKPISEDLNALSTTDKTSLVGAINEVNAKSSGGGEEWVHIATIDALSNPTPLPSFYPNGLYDKLRLDFNAVGFVDAGTRNILLYINGVTDANAYIGFRENTSNGSGASVTNFAIQTTPIWNTHLLTGSLYFERRGDGEGSTTEGLITVEGTIAFAAKGTPVATLTENYKGALKQYSGILTLMLGASTTVTFNTGKMKLWGVKKK